MRCVVLWLAAIIAGVSSPETAGAEPRRFALLIGTSDGAANQERLHFAESDANRIGAILREVGGFASEDVVVLTSATASELRRALIAINARIREVPGDTLLFVFYSGHADIEALQLAGTRLPMSELRDLIYGSPATARVLVLDACRSGSVTRSKGGRRAPAFAIDLDDQLHTKGVAIMTSSAEGEDSQESDALRASFFTHYLASGMRGAADADADGRVTLVEVFSYASERTLAATSRTFAGPQHPTYRFDLTGRDDLVLTRPVARGQRIGTLVFAERGTYFVQLRDASVAEVEITTVARSLALPADDYTVTRRARDHLLTGRFTVEGARATPVRAAAMERIEYARVVRKGGTALRRSTSFFAGGVVRSSLDRTWHGQGFGAEVGARLDLPVISLELRLQAVRFPGLEMASGKPPLPATRELGATVVGARAFDMGRWTLALGGALGMSEHATEYAAVVGGIAQLQRVLVGPLFLRVEADALGYVFSSSSPGRPYDMSLGWSAHANAGAYF